MSKVYRKIICNTALALSAALICNHSLASVVITGTRLIYSEKDKEITVALNNKSESPVLVQSWMDSGDIHSNPSNADAPFMLTPPIFRMDPETAQSVRMRFVGAPLPGDRESVFYFNMLEVPAKPENVEGENLLQVAFRSRIKVFYRPTKIQNRPNDAAEKLQWKVVKLGNEFNLQVYNPSAFYVSFGDVDLVEGKERFAATSDMVEPGGRINFALPTLKKAPGAQATVNLNAINDWGAYVPYTQKLSQ